jgi:hypothetical protein
MTEPPAEPVQPDPAGPIQGFQPIKFRPFPPPPPVVDPVVTKRLKELSKHDSPKVRAKANLVLGLVNEKEKKKEEGG